MDATTSAVSGPVQPFCSAEELLTTFLCLRFRERLRCVRHAQKLWGRPHESLSDEDRYCIAMAAGVKDATTRFAVRSRQDGGFDVLVMEQNNVLGSTQPGEEAPR